MSKTLSQKLLEQFYEKNEMTLMYQPLVSRENHVIAYEVLMRWRSETLGDIPPLEVLESFEQQSLIGKLNDIFFQKLSSDLRKFKSLTKAKICINLSFKQLEEASILQNIETLSRCIPFDCMMFEITENAILNDVKKVISVINQLALKGVSFILDNFGAGYFSLKHLKVLPLDAIKINRALISEIDLNHKDLAIIKAAIEMAKALGFDVIAEGVENESQLTLLKASGVKYFQGYYFSKPKMPHLI